MNNILQIYLIAGIILYFIVVFGILKRKAISLKYSLLWLLSGLVMLVIALCPQSVEWVSGVLGIVSPVNTVFIIAIFFMILILMSLTSIVSKQTEKIKVLIQTIGILEKRIRDLEEDYSKLD